MTSVLADLAGVASQSFELSMIAKATVVLSLGLGAAYFLRHARASLRHLVLTVTFAGLVALPLGVALLPSISIEMPPPGPAPTEALRPEPGTSSDPAIPGAPRSTGEAAGLQLDPASVVRGVWVFGSMVLLISLAAGLLRLARIGRSALPWLETGVLVRDLAASGGVSRRVAVVLHEVVPAPLTFGILRPLIVLPAGARRWSDAEVRRAVIHELEHVHRCDWFVQVLARTVCALYWFHPLVWVAWRRLSLEAERACDDAVIRSAERTEYAEQLVELARQMKMASAPALVAMANRTDLSTRVTALLDQTLPRGRAGRRAAALVLPVAAAAILAIAPLRAVTVARPGDGSSVGENAVQSRRIRALERELVEAAADGDVKGITDLLDAGADINAKVDGDGSPLIAAAREGHVRTVQFLLERGADPNLGVEGDGNPLIMAAREGHTAIVELLLARGVVVDQVVPGDENALIQASGAGRLEVVAMLVAHGADVNAAVWVDDYRGGGEWRTPLGMALKGRHAAVEKFLRSKGASR